MLRRRTLLISLLFLVGLASAFFYFELNEWSALLLYPPQSTPITKGTPVWKDVNRVPHGFDVPLRGELQGVSKIAVTSLDFRIDLKEIENLLQLCEKTASDPSWRILIVQEDEQKDKEEEERTKSPPSEGEDLSIAELTEGKLPKKPLKQKEEKQPQTLPSFPHPCLLLSIEEQDKLPYRIAARSFPRSRKNIGYLFAIQHGSDIILDLDPIQSHITDPLPINFRAREMMDFGPFTKELKDRPGVVNPYRFYGLSHLRPRGFPLDFQEPTNYTWQPWSFGEEHCPIPDGVEVILPIQQGLLRKNPDATNGSSVSRFSDPTYYARPLPWQPGIAIDKGSFTPLLGKNAYFYKEGFWGLMMPTTKLLSGMEGDVFRGFWVQRLLWDIGHNLGFFYTTVTRNVQHYTSPSKSRVEDEPQSSMKLIQFLSSWTHNVNITNTFDRVIDIYIDMAQNGFISTEEVEYAFDWLNDLFELDYSPPESISSWSREKTFAKPTNSIETLRGDNNDPNVIKKTERMVPDEFRDFPEDTDLILMYYKEKNETNQGIFYPTATWTEGRNRGFQEALQREKYYGYQYHFMYFTDDDWLMECKLPELQADKMKCFDYVNKIHDKWEPAVGDCSKPPPDFIHYTEDSEADLTWLDAFWNGMHREFVDMVVPYNRTYDVVAWPGSQGYVRLQTATFWPRHVMTFTKIYCDQNVHRPYTGRNNITSWGQIADWIHSELPDYFKWRLVDWAGGYMGKGSPHEASMKSRVYDDVCSVSTPTQLSYCLDRT